MEQLFTPPQRDRAIDTTLRFLALADAIDLFTYADAMRRLQDMSDTELGLELLTARQLYFSYLESSGGEDKYKQEEWI